ncbi:prepilin-type N-terminal cleavage/methylation domain-containing protein [Neobacillus niacini]|uniref:prepilin-type N-terminal cleavage/methylation domain-containing protein n=1 Tax=Neobacillus niacini TaxID=86668 RepID=UPI0028651E68|nr:prepilin-type N-terminal cleavage/methylation domain-containing protein [Neobacillus niacini]MDR7077910.1 prepilin-type N-terminal cleavage/methylation domain-containing protein [Neobacillus niacini]
MKRGNHGLTLIEVLATLTILSIVGVIIWSVFFQGYKFSKESISKNFMIQETNILITNLKRIHQTSENYRIENDDGKINVYIDGKTSPDVFAPPQMRYEVVVKIKKKDDDSAPAIIGSSDLIVPNDYDVYLEVLTSENGKRENNISIDTFLYRLRGVGY